MFLYPHFNLDMLLLVREMLLYFSFLISNMSFPFCLHNTILFLFSASFYHRYPISLIFRQSPRIRCSIVSSIVAAVVSITTRGSPEALWVLKRANSHKWKRKRKEGVSREQNSIINSFSVSPILFLFVLSLSAFFSSVHIVSKRASVVNHVRPMDASTIFKLFSWKGENSFVL